MHRRILAALSYGHLATDLSQGAIPALLPVFKAHYHLSYMSVGLIVLIASVSSSVIQPAFGILSDRIKLHWLMPLGTLLAGVGMVLAVVSRHYGLTIAMIFLSGLGVAAFHPEGYRFAGLSSGARRATGMSYFSVGGNLGYGLGPAAASVALSLWGAGGIVYILAFSIPAALVLWRTASPATRDLLEARWTPPADVAAAPAASASAQAAQGSVLVLTWLVVFVVLRSWVSVGTASFIPLYFTGVRRFDPWYAGVLVSVFLGAGAVGTLLGGMAADRWGRRNMLIVSMAILPPLLWLIPRTAGAWPLASAFVAGMAAVSTFAVVMVMAQALIPHRVGLISGLIIGFAVGMGGVGVTALGAVADRWGVLTAMDACALLPFAALVIALWLPRDSTSGRNPAARDARTSMSGAEARAGGE